MTASPELVRWLIAWAPVFVIFIVVLVVLRRQVKRADRMLTLLTEIRDRLPPGKGS